VTALGKHSASVADGVRLTSLRFVSPRPVGLVVEVRSASTTPFHSTITPACWQAMVLADGVRFELTEACTSAVFKSDFRDSLQYLATHCDNKFNSLPMQVFCAGLQIIARIRHQVSHHCPMRDISGQLV